MEPEELLNKLLKEARRDLVILSNACIDLLENSMNVNKNQFLFYFFDRYFQLNFVKEVVEFLKEKGIEPRIILVRDMTGWEDFLKNYPDFLYYKDKLLIIVYLAKLFSEKFEVTGVYDHGFALNHFHGFTVFYKKGNSKYIVRLEPHRLNIILEFDISEKEIKKLSKKYLKDIKIGIEQKGEKVIVKSDNKTMEKLLQDLVSESYVL